MWSGLFLRSESSSMRASRSGSGRDVRASYREREESRLAERSKHWLGVV